MKKAILVLVLSFCAVVFAATSFDSIEVLEAGDIPDHSQNAIPKAYSRLHDKKSGVEVLCFRDSDDGIRSSISCVATGRNWK